MIYPNTFEQKIGFNTVREYISSRCNTELGMHQVDNMKFISKYEIVSKLLHQTNEFLSIIKERDDYPIINITDITKSLLNCRLEGTYLTEVEVFNLNKAIGIMSDVALFFDKEKADDNRYPYLSEFASSISKFPSLSKEINRVIDKSGNVKDNASSRLLELKKQLNDISSGINKTLRRILSLAKDNGIVDRDAVPSIRDGRLVLPVLPMYKRKIRGIVHDESMSGKTIYIEPAEIVEANNEIRELESDIKREIIKILLDLTTHIRPYIDEILGSYKILGTLDFIHAKAKFALDFNGNLPNLEETPDIEWYNAVHPVLYSTLSGQGKSVVPLNITLDSKSRILLISGPNAGGKSVCLKTVAITQYMLQCGLLPIMYDNSHIGIFDSIFIDIGDEQSIEDDLSTYSSHLINMKNFLHNSNERTLVLIDEFGGGTEPQIGGAIAQSILNELNNKKVMGVITTHYQNLKNFADATDGIINGAMLYDREHMKPLFSLSIGYPGSSFAIEIARKIGLSEGIINDAKEIVGSDYIKLDKYILDISRDKKYWENKRQQIRIKEKKLDTLVNKYDEEIDQLSIERKEIIKKAKAEAKELLSSTNSKIEKTIHSIKKANAEKEKTKLIRRELEEFKEKILSKNEQNTGIPKRINPKNSSVSHTNGDILKVGDRVTLDGSNSVGEIVSINGKSVEVIFGILKSKVEISRLKRTDKKATDNSSVTINTNDQSRIRQLNFSPDIDVRGMSVDEAIQAVTYFLDDAIQFDFNRVRVLHGTGNGILRHHIRTFLNSYPNVESYKDEHVQFGGAGITIINLK